MLTSHFRAGSGAVLIETREESRFLRTILAELPTADVCTVAAPGGPIIDARTGSPKKHGEALVGNGLASGYKWAQDGIGRILVVWDWHMLVNNPGHWRALIEEESTAQIVVVATLNRLDKLDAALESRFQARFFFDLPSLSERHAVAQIHYARLECEGVDSAARATADYTEGYSSREIAEHICPSVARRSSRKPTAEIISQVASGYTPASRTQAEQIQQMRRAAASLRRANDPEESRRNGNRRIA